MKMNKTILTALLVVGTTLTSIAGSKKVATINGVEIYRVRTAGGFFCPPTTTIIAADPTTPGRIAVINSGVAPSVVQQAFTPAVEGAGLCGAAFLLRPSQTNVSQSGGGASASGGNSSADATGGNATGGNATAVSVAGATSSSTSSASAVNNNSSAPCKKDKKPKGPKN